MDGVSHDASCSQDVPLALQAWESIEHRVMREDVLFDLLHRKRACVCVCGYWSQAHFLAAVGVSEAVSCSWLVCTAA